MLIIKGTEKYGPKYWQRKNISIYFELHYIFNLKKKSNVINTQVFIENGRPFYFFPWVRGKYFMIKE
jgi:hypothetical protein